MPRKKNTTIPKISLDKDLSRDENVSVSEMNMDFFSQCSLKPITAEELLGDSQFTFFDEVGEEMKKAFNISKSHNNTFPCVRTQVLADNTIDSSQFDPVQRTYTIPSHDLKTIISLQLRKIFQKLINILLLKPY